MHADPMMDPDYESEGDDGGSNYKRKGLYLFVSSNSVGVAKLFSLFICGMGGGGWGVRKK